MQQRHPFIFHGRGAEFFGIWIVNVFLSVITLGIYSAWAKVRDRQYMYGNLELDGDRFEYLATPLQILLGRIIAIVLVIGWLVAQSTAPFVAGFLFLIGLAVFPALTVRNKRFDMRMTRFRNVRFDFVGSYGGAYLNLLAKPVLAYVLVMAAFFGSIFFTGGIVQGGEPSGLGVLLALVSLFLLGPLAAAWVLSSIDAYLLDNVRYGGKDFHCRLSSKVYLTVMFKTAGMILLATLALFSVIFVFAVLAAIIGGINGTDMENFMQGIGGTLFIIGGIALYLTMFAIGFVVRAFYIARIRNYRIAQLTTDFGLKPESRVRTWPYARLLLVNFVITVFSLGLAYPVARVWHARYLADHTSVAGDMDKVQVWDHDGDERSALADEVAGAFDVEIGLV